MSRRIAACLVSLLACVGAVDVASATDLGLITGGENGAYHRFGLDLKKLVKSGGINLRVYPSKGSIENLYAVHQRPGIHLGIVQSDVLAFVADLPSHPALARIRKGTRLVFPLYDEEVHVLGRRGIVGFEDLAGKRVAVGRDESGASLTARRLFQLSEVRPGERVPIDGAEALAELKAGRIDAMIYVAAAPVRFLRDDVTGADGLALIPISSKAILESYTAVEIPGSAYEWQTTPVTTVAVKAVLVSFDFRGPECDRVGRFAQQIAKGLDWLRTNGHPKWKSVDLDVALEGWEQYNCVRKYLGRQSAQGRR